MGPHALNSREATVRQSNVVEIAPVDNSNSWLVNTEKSSSDGYSSQLRQLARSKKGSVVPTVDRKRNKKSNSVGVTPT